MRQRTSSAGRTVPRLLAPLAVLVALVVVVGCQSDSVHAEDPTSVAPTITGSGPMTSTPALTSSAPTPPSKSQTSTPPTYGDAQTAVDAYLAMLKAGNAAFRDPKHANTTTIDKYADGQIRFIYHQSLERARRQGIAYRGTPATPRVTVVSAATVASLPKVVLRDCALSSVDHPWTAYSIATGTALPPATHKVPPPYANTITVFKTKGSWRVFTVKTDGTRTCHP